MAEVLRSGHDPSCGAEVVFVGVVRDASCGKRVLSLDYEAYEDMAEAVIGRLVEEARQRWLARHVQVRHRLGKLHVSEIAVAIGVSCEHRAPAYEASRFLIEGIKHRVPIWKKEFFSDGTCLWGGCHDLADVSTSSSKDCESHAPARAEVSAHR